LSGKAWLSSFFEFDCKFELFFELGFWSLVWDWLSVVSCFGRSAAFGAFSKKLWNHQFMLSGRLQPGRLVGDPHPLAHQRPRGLREREERLIAVSGHLRPRPMAWPGCGVAVVVVYHYPRRPGPLGAGLMTSNPFPFSFVYARALALTSMTFACCVLQP